MVWVALALCAVSSLATLGRSSAQAQATAAATHPVTPDFKGTVGVGLIGMELGLVLPAVAGARDTWEYIVFPVIGAGGGAAAGYFLLEHGKGHPELAVASLVTGMALLIPALVVTLSETAYDPEEEAPLGDLQRRRLQSAAAAGPGLLRLSERGAFLAPPVVSVEQASTLQQAMRTGAPQARTMHAAVVSGVF